MQHQVKVLYVEDEPSIAKLLSSGLGMFGITVFPVFASGEALLKLIDSAEYLNADILIFDIRLPGMTGIDLASHLRTQGENRPIVLVSAWPAPSPDDLATIQATFLPKPFDFSDVVQTIQKLTKTDA